VGVGTGLCMYEHDVIIKKFTFAISFPDVPLTLHSILPSIKLFNHCFIFCYQQTSHKKSKSEFDGPRDSSAVT